MFNKISTIQHPAINTAHLAAICAIALWTFGAVPASASSIVVSAPHITAAPGSTGYFDVSLSNTNPGGGASFDVTAFDYTLSLTPTPGVEFTDADTSSTNYIFAGTGAKDFLGVPLSLDGFPNTSFRALDLAFDPISPIAFVTVDPGDTFTLGRVFFDVSAVAPPGSVFTLNFSGVDIIDPEEELIDFEAVNGSITIAPHAVPTPAAAGAGLAGFAFLALRRWRRTSKQEHSTC